jgi:aminoacylase
MEHIAVTKFREYLKIKTVHPTPDYAGAIQFLKQYAEEYGFKYDTFEVVPGKPFFMIKHEGEDPSLPAVLLNSHMDVVPFFAERWKVDPFSAHKDEEGNIYARGTQDMKCVTIQYIEALHRLKQSGKTFARTIYIAAVPDEEIGGHDGVAKWVQTPQFKALNIGFALDEGLASPDASMTLFKGERAPCWLYLKASGPTGHGSRLFEGTAVDKLHKCLEKFTSFRDAELSKLKAQGLTLGEVTTVNINMLKSGVWSDHCCGGWQTNIIPPDAEAAVDIRIAPTVDLPQFYTMIEDWCKDVTLTYQQKTPTNVITPTDDSNPWWVAFKAACDTAGAQLDIQIFPAATDSRYIRVAGVPAFGFSPINHTPILLHDHNEFLNEKIFLHGIEVYVPIIERLANVKA